MGFYKKTILLSNQGNYNSGMAILNIEKTGAGNFASLKIFDIDRANNLILGISLNGKEVIKQNIVFTNNNVFNFKLNDNFDCSGKVGCVLVQKLNNEIKPLVWGTNGLLPEYKQNIIGSFVEKNPLQNKEVDVASVIEKESNVEVEIVDCENKSKVADLFESSDEEIENAIDNELDSGFYSVIEDQLDELFGQFPLYDELMQLVPNSKWIKVDYEDNTNEYILGLIYENNDVKYICYGVPGDINSLPPKELQAYSQWLSLDGENGYWVMFQDAKTGDNVLVEDAVLS